MYAGHSHHVKTGSTKFLIDLLATRFEVTTIADESWLPGKAPLDAARINALEPDAVVFFQLILSRPELRKLACRNITWIPMHDGVRYRSTRYWRYAGAGLKALHFSATTERFFARYRYDNFAVQYFWPPLPPVDATAEKPDLFFWVRRSEPGWETLKRLLGDFRPRRIVMRHAPDPGYQSPRPSEADIAAYHIELHTDWLEHAAYRALLQSCQLFMAPRLLEGIGQATNEAMSMGQCVIAPDAATMNEYVRHGETGLLYDPANPQPLDFSRWRELGAAARASAVAGRERWLAAEGALLDFIARAPARGETLIWRLARQLGR